MGASTAFPWESEDYKPQGERWFLDQAIICLEGSILGKIRKKAIKPESQIRGGFRPEITTLKSVTDTALPLIADGSRLSRKGANFAIENLAKAFNLELKQYENLGYSSKISNQLDQLAGLAKQLSLGLLNFPPEAQWRLAEIPSDWLLPSNRQSKIPNYLMMEYENVLGCFNKINLEDYMEYDEDAIPYDALEGLPASDMLFIRARAGELVPWISGKPTKDSKLINELIALNQILLRASAKDQGAMEDGGALRAYRESMEHPIFLLIRECDAILCATSMNTELEAPGTRTEGKKSFPYSFGLKLLVKRICEYAVGDGIISESQIENHLRKYGDSYNTVTDVDPWAWRVYRISRLRIFDLEKNGDNKKENYSLTWNRLNDICTRYKYICSFQLEKKHPTVEELHQEFIEKQERKNELQSELNSSNYENDEHLTTIKNIIRSLEQDLIRLEPYCTIESPSSRPRKDPAELRQIGMRPRPRGLTFLSNSEL